MTRFARMPKKKYIEASSWDELSRQQEVKQEEATNDEEQQPVENSKLESKIKKKKKKSKKRNLETEDDSIASEPVSSPKKQKTTDSNTSESKIERKKDKKKERFQPQDEKRTLSKDTEEHTSKAVDSTKAGEGQGKKVKFVRSRKAERREKANEARRQRRFKRKNFICFCCRQFGHQAAECPQTKQEGTGIGVCYKCGSSDHTTRNCMQKGTEKGGNPFPFAKCFICGEVGHLSSGCPDNPKGLYPKGGGCRFCGSVEHFKRDCPETMKSKKKGVNIKVNSASADAEVHSDDEEPQVPKQYYKKKKTEKTVKF